MSAPQFEAPAAIAFQLAARLERYERDVAAIERLPLDPELYRRVSSHIEQMRMYAGSLPAVSVSWVEVTIRHFEFIHGLWRAQQGDATVDLPQLQQQLHGAIRALSLRCRQLVPSS